MNHIKHLIPSLGGSLRIALGTALLVGLAGCDGLAGILAKPDKQAEPVVVEQPPPVPAAKETKIPSKKMSSKLYEWKGDGRPVTRVVVNTTEQKARFYAGEDEVGWATVATGVAKYPTPTGSFQVIEKVENKRSNLYGKVYGKGGKVIKSSVKVGRDPIPAGARFEGAKMPFFMRLTNDGVGLHAGPIPRPGRPASHGCIRMPSKFAPVAFAHVAPGTPVEIVGKGPSYASYLSKQRRIAAQQAARKKPAAAPKPVEQTPSPAGAQVAAAEPAAPSAAPAAAAAATAAAATAIEEVAQAEDQTAAAQAVEPAAPQETRMRQPAEAMPAAPEAQAQAAAEPSAPAAPEPPKQPSAAPKPEAPAAPTQAAAAQSPAEPKPAVAAEKPKEPAAAAPTAPAETPKPAAKAAEPAKPVLETKEVALPAPKPAPEPPAPAPAPKPEAKPAPKPAAAAPAPAPAPTEAGAT